MNVIKRSYFPFVVHKSICINGVNIVKQFNHFNLFKNYNQNKFYLSNHLSGILKILSYYFIFCTVFVCNIFAADIAFAVL